MNTSITIPYGHTQKTIELPEDNLAWVAGPNDTEPLVDLPAAIRQALQSPIGSSDLSSLVKQHGTKTVILVDDSTRPTPQALILPILLAELNAAGVDDKDITVVIALGTHRPMDRDECAARFGEEVMARVRVENLTANPDDYEDLGVTPLGVPIHVSRQYLECDLSIAVGNIIPHMYAGWAGGAKMVQPGVTNPETTAKTHLMAGSRVYEILGNVDNPVRREMEEIAVQTGLKFILNVVLDRHSHVVDVVAGDVVAAHRAGVERARPIYEVELPEQPDIVIAGSHPADRDLWQGFKPVNNCGMAVKDGGTLILVIPAPEGIAPDHPQMLELGVTPGSEVPGMVERGEVTDGVAAATYLALDQTRRRVTIDIVTDGFTNNDAAQLGLTAGPDMQSALQRALDRHGNDARIGVVTHGADIMAVFSKS